MKIRFGRWMWLLGCALSGGCGITPEALLDSARESAKEAVEEQVDALMEEFVDDALDAAGFDEELTEVEE